MKQLRASTGCLIVLIRILLCTWAVNDVFCLSVSLCLLPTACCSSESGSQVPWLRPCISLVPSELFKIVSSLQYLALLRWLPLIFAVRL